MTPTPNLRPQRIEIALANRCATAAFALRVEPQASRRSAHQSTFADVREAALDLINAAESLREQAAETLVVRDAWDREREARSQRYFEGRP
jgi:hypothetical protein